MHTAGAAVMAVALLTGATIGATAQDGGGPLSTDDMLAPFVTEEVEPGVLRLTDAPDDYLRLLERAGVMRQPKGVRNPLVRVAPVYDVGDANDDARPPRRCRMVLHPSAI